MSKDCWHRGVRDSVRGGKEEIGAVTNIHTPYTNMQIYKYAHIKYKYTNILSERRERGDGGSDG